jgi:hypothetical protein
MKQKFGGAAGCPLLGGMVVAWRAGARLFREMWPLIQTHVPEDDFRAEFVRDLLRFFMECDMEGTDLRRVHPEIDKALDELGEGEG